MEQRVRCRKYTLANQLEDDRDLYNARTDEAIKAATRTELTGSRQKLDEMHFKIYSAKRIVSVQHTQKYCRAPPPNPMRTQSWLWLGFFFMSNKNCGGCSCAVINKYIYMYIHIYRYMHALNLLQFSAELTPRTGCVHTYHDEYICVYSYLDVYLWCKYVYDIHIYIGE